MDAGRIHIADNDEHRHDIAGKRSERAASDKEAFHELELILKEEMREKKG